MAYVQVPKDLTRVKTKVMFNLTKRQLICFGGAAAISKVAGDARPAAFSGPIHLFLAVMVALYAASWALSAAFYRKKEF